MGLRGTADATSATVNAFEDDERFGAAPSYIGGVNRTFFVECRGATDWHKIV
jgi:hypothetical protein